MNNLLRAGMLFFWGMSLLLGGAFLGGAANAVELEKVAQKGITSGAATDDHMEKGEKEDCTRPVSFTEEQKRKLDELYAQLATDLNRLIQTYHEYGALTAEQKAYRLDMLKRHLDWIKKNDYRWCTEHEQEDGKEEWEWFDD